MERALSAPGKLFLSGEYAVLWGGTARIAAVGPRAAALVRRRADREVHIAVAEGRLSGAATPVGVAWPDPVPPPFRFVARALDVALRAHARETLGFEVALAPGPTVEGHKLGVGGSARAAVLAAEAARYILEERFDTLKLSLLAHLSAQGGGSGGDVAAIFAGGVVRYRRYDAQPLLEAASTGQLGAALAAAAPVDLWRLPHPQAYLAYAFSGQSSSTQGLVEGVEQRVTGAARATFVARSDEHGQALEEALIARDFRGVSEAVGALHALLAGLGPLETEPLSRLLAIARSYGCAGKISGAGGGDGCVLFAPDDATRSALLEGLSSRGFFAMALALEAGLHGEPAADPELSRWLRV
jgi:phosphomevalonate kinase